LVDFEYRAYLTIFPDLGPFGLLVSNPRTELFDDVFGFGGDPGLQVLDVEGVVEGGDFLGSGFFGVVHFELRREGVVVDEAVHHFHAFGFHGVLLAQLVLRDVFVIEVAHFSHFIICRHNSHNLSFHRKSGIFVCLPALRIFGLPFNALRGVWVTINSFEFGDGEVEVGGAFIKGSDRA
jgi:hypothetical protein